MSQLASSVGLFLTRLENMTTALPALADTKLTYLVQSVIAVKSLMVFIVSQGTSDLKFAFPNFIIAMSNVEWIQGWLSRLLRCSRAYFWCQLTNKGNLRCICHQRNFLMTTGSSVLDDKTLFNIHNIFQQHSQKALSGCKNHVVGQKFLQLLQLVNQSIQWT